MLVGEGSWETPNIANTNPELLNFAKQDVLPVSNDPAANNLQLQTIGISVTNTANPERIKAAKEFASYIIDSPEAAKWHQELMGSPTSVITLEVSDQLPALGKDVIALMQEGRAAESMYRSCLPSSGRIWKKHGRAMWRRASLASSSASVVGRSSRIMPADSTIDLLGFTWIHCEVNRITK